MLKDNSKITKKESGEGGGAVSDGRCVRTDAHPNKGITFLSFDFLLEFTNCRHGLKGYLNKIFVICVSSV